MTIGMRKNATLLEKAVVLYKFRAVASVGLAMVAVPFMVIRPVTGIGLALVAWVLRP